MNAFERHGIDHLSASHVNLFIAQPAMWAASYLMKRTGVGPAAHRGSAIECGVEQGLFDPTMPIGACQDAALAKYHSLTRLSADPRIEKERECIAPSVEVALTELRQYGVPDQAEGGRQHKIEIDLPGVACSFRRLSRSAVSAARHVGRPQDDSAHSVGDQRRSRPSGRDLPHRQGQPSGSLRLRLGEEDRGLCLG
jgi:hypothetical protein